MNYKTLFGNPVSWFFGFIVMAIGIINTFWGNDTGAGIFIFLLSFIYFPPVGSIVKEKLSFNISPVIKIVLGVLILVGALGVGELFYKIDLMLMDF